jgi:hypothetical protein
VNKTAEILNANPPSAIRILVPPFVGTLGSAELEHAAALLVRACQVRGDRWQPMLYEEMEEALRDDVSQGRGPLCRFLQSPFLSPDFARLVEGQWAAWHGEPGKGKLELAPRTIMAIAAKWGRARG